MTPRRRAQVFDAGVDRSFWTMLVSAGLAKTTRPRGSMVMMGFDGDFVLPILRRAGQAVQCSSQVWSPSSLSDLTNPRLELIDRSALALEYPFEF